MAVVEDEAVEEEEEEEVEEEEEEDCLGQPPLPFLGDPEIDCALFCVVLLPYIVVRTALAGSGSFVDLGPQGGGKPLGSFSSAPP